MLLCWCGRTCLVCTYALPRDALVLLHIHTRRNRQKVAIYCDYDTWIPLCCWHTHNAISVWKIVRPEYGTLRFSFSLALQYKPKGLRNIVRPRKRWRDQLHLKDQENRKHAKPFRNMRWWTFGFTILPYYSTALTLLWYHGVYVTPVLFDSRFFFWNCHEYWHRLLRIFA